MNTQFVINGLLLIFANPPFEFSSNLQFVIVGLAAMLDHPSPVQSGCIAGEGDRTPYRRRPYRCPDRESRERAQDRRDAR
jgi:hypothetical protein